MMSKIMVFWQSFIQIFRFKQLVNKDLNIKYKYIRSSNI
jgi:hypothetical protein